MSGDVAKSARARRRLPLGVLMAAFGVAVAALGVLAGSILFPAAPPQTLTQAPEAEAVGVTYRDFSDERSVELAVSMAPDQYLTAPMSGLVVKFDCVEGGVIKAGTSPVQIDGTHLVALPTKVPLWRDLKIGDHGEDAAAVNKALQVLGFKVESGDRVTVATLTATERLVTKAGNSLVSKGVVDKKYFMWIPMSETMIGSCQVLPGRLVSAGEGIALVSRTPVSARVKIPQDAILGERVVSIAGETFPVDADGAVTADKLSALGATDEMRLAVSMSESDPQLTGRLMLAQSVRVAVVPPGAVAGLGGDKACVFTDDTGRSVAVELVGSELGQSFVIPATGQELTSVQLKPKPSWTCQ